MILRFLRKFDIVNSIHLVEVVLNQMYLHTGFFNALLQRTTV